MGIKYTKKNDDKKEDERTVQAEEFVNLMTSFRKKTEEKKELPLTETDK
jgi:hypothetical protein